MSSCSGWHHKWSWIVILVALVLTGAAQSEESEPTPEAIGNTASPTGVAPSPELAPPAATTPPESIALPLLINPEHSTAELQAELERIQTQQAQLQRQLQQVASKVTSLQTGTSTPTTELKVFDGFGVAASKVYYSDSPLAIGASADLLSFADEQSTDSPSINTWRLSPHLGYRLNRNLIFNSRFTFENTGAEVHAAGSEPKGQVRVEFAYLDILHSGAYNLRLGQQLLPVGLVNQRQDGVFYPTVNPPEVETQLLPATWSEQGITWWGASDSIHYQLGLFNSLSATRFTADTFIRDGRQSGQLAKVRDAAGVFRVDHVSKSGIFGVSGFVGNTAQDSTIVDQGTIRLFEAHVQTFSKPIALSAVYVEGQLEHADSISLAITGNPAIPAKANGYYVTLSADMLTVLDQPGRAGAFPIFVEFSQYNLHAAMPTSYTADPTLNRTRTTFGFNYRPQENVVFKADYQQRKNKVSKEDDLVSFGISLVF